MSEPEQQLALESRSNYLLRQGISDVVVSNKEILAVLTRLVEIEQRRDMDYSIFEISATGKPAFTVRVGRQDHEPINEWLARQKEALEGMEAIRKPRIPLKEEVENINRPQISYGGSKPYYSRRDEKREIARRILEGGSE